jgi:hypothetical protein
VAAPPNDNIADAILISSFPAVVTTTLVDATVQPNEPGDSDFTATVWYRFVAPYDGTLVFRCNGPAWLLVHAGNFGNLPYYHNNQKVIWSELQYYYDYVNGDYQVEDTRKSLGRLRIVQGAEYYLQVAKDPWYDTYVDAQISNLKITLDPGAPNDDVANATLIPSLPFVISQEVTGASLAPVVLINGIFTFTEPSGSFLSFSWWHGTVWFKYVASTTAKVRFHTKDSNYDTRLAVYDASFVQVAYNDRHGPWTGVYGSDRKSQLDVNLVAGATYYIQVSDRGEADSFGRDALDLVLTCDYSPPAPPNDDRANATLISSLPTLLTQSTQGATLEPNEPGLNFYEYGLHATVWFQFISPVTGWVRINTLGSDYDTFIRVYNNSLTFIVDNNDIYQTRQSEVDFQAVQGSTYWVQVAGWSGVEGTLVLSVDASPAPPANDNIADATLITSLPFAVTQSTFSATRQVNEPSVVAQGLPRDTVWFKYTATVTANIRIDTLESNFSTSIAIYDQDPATFVEATLPLMQNEDYRQATQPVSGGFAGRTLPALADFQAVQGVTYLIQVGGASTSQANGTLVFKCQYSPPPPLNDNKATATLITSLPFKVTQSTEAATIEPLEQSSSVWSTRRFWQASVWFKYVAPVTAEVFISWSVNYWHLVSVILGEPEDENFVLFGSGSSPTSVDEISFPAVAGQTYYIVISGRKGDFGTLTLSASSSTVWTPTNVRQRPNYNPATVGDPSDYFYVSRDGGWDNTTDTRVLSSIARYGMDATLQHEISNSSLDPVGGAVNPVTGDPWWTNFRKRTVLSCSADLDPANLVVRSWYPFNNTPESIFFRGSFFFVGNADGDKRVYKHEVSTGELLEVWKPTTGRGTDWIALANDDDTLIYTTERRDIRRYSLGSREQLPDFAQGLPGTTAVYSVLLRRNDSHIFLGTGNRRSIMHFDAAGNLVDEFFPRRPGDLFGPYTFACALTRDENEILVGNFYSNDSGSQQSWASGSRSYLWRINIKTGDGENAPIGYLPEGMSTNAVFSIGGQVLTRISGLQKDSLFQFE